ncbi:MULTISPECIES: phenylalanine--tRNA ligase subunit beta [unclassified Lentimonas]|uniref:phenylalanine--tRNA ligase subunit beta n=1 Tax=unclassified Lentimonas TaxID=2630993 RepID=UPI001325AC50|nr:MULTISPECIES: phenylalanine--tRNA ligase subunit beta [unclassified Lentimonas]CAA6678523.1 Phenylalanyl-tRNA synthetase beta chain (EC [Lentimonas sp. CC4]CAA6685755.1 Phenylalanyl-tRNA synthetase beta chain (EC [Lentimonas sp. CC6]CAA7076229.1 Phenylalanyl-tRNA synthetase beta chain (EC [Lentimonas sp. CC4]CAA7168718.1 Phenylalanyl-tRNA synthetase beta chain (EC [Lentimonas sp. CC21]CAA7183457.1 Phenylalanyl-tRNA synthetase beta chain (EC [Lentimonas sp. CC8]
MKISYNWLKNYIDLDEVAHSPEVLAEALPLLGFDIEEYEKLGPPQFNNVVVGQVLEYGQHPDADRLRCCKVSTGNEGEVHDIVCGAKNFEQGDKVMVALPGAVLPGNFKIKASKLRGQPSAGMMCSAKELQIGQDHDGIMILDGDVALGTAVNDLYTDGDTVFNLEITPNRVDVLSHIGVARELSARFGLAVKYPEVKASTASDSSGEPLISGVEVSAPEVCPHYTATCIKGVKVGPSPKWLKEAIEATGQRSINNVVDVTNYVLHETCQPLHAFDAAKIKGDKLVVRMAAEGEKLTTLDEKERTLTADMAVIADAERALVVAGVMGSLDAEVEDSTTDIVLEAAYFDPSSVRATARQLTLSTDSSYRFERGVDPQGVEYAALRAIDLILEVAGGTVDGPMIVEGQFVETISEVQIKPDNIRKFIGFDISDEEIQAALESLEMSVSVHDESDGSKRWEVSIPSFRGDLQRDVDLIEEVVRIYGTDKIPESSVVARGISTTDHRIYTVNDAVADYLTGENFDEAYLYSLRDPDETKFFFGEEGFKVLALDNPLQSDQSHLRPSLIPGLVDVLKLNNARGTGATRFFERGHVYREVKGEMVELISVGFVILADQVSREWRQREVADFYTARTLAGNVLDIAGTAASKLNFKPIDDCKLWQGGQSAYAGEFAKMGFECTAGLLNVATLKERWGIDQPVIAGSILMTPKFFERKAKRGRHTGISNQPASAKDLALIVDQSVLAGTVENDVAKFAKKATQGFACESVRVFDVYEGEGLPEGKKSLAVSMSFRAADRTLKDKEVNTAFEGIQKLISDKTDYQIRK